MSRVDPANTSPVQASPAQASSDEARRIIEEVVREQAGAAPSDRAGSVRAGARAKFFLQIVLFAAGVVLAVWAVVKVFSPSNRAQLERLTQASAWEIVLLAALSALTIVVNGWIFQIQLRPVRALGTARVQSVNAIASLLSYLPFKLSLVFRVVMHRILDGLAVLSIGAWFGAVGVVLLLAMGPLLAASFIRGRLDGGWFAIAGAGVVVLTGVAVALARALRNEDRWTRWTHWIMRAPAPDFVRRLLQGPGGLLARMHEGVAMLSSPGVVGGALLLRLADISIHTFRLLIAARILGVELSLEQAIIAGAAYFLIGAAAPAGQVGVRDAGTAGVLGALMPGMDIDQVLVLPLLVTATEAATLILLSAAAGAYLRPDRLVRARASR